MKNRKDTFEMIVLCYIDAYVDLYGEINSTVITSKLPIHRTKVSGLFTRYLKLKPSNLRNVGGQRGYIKGYSFERLYLKDESSLSFINAIDIAFKERDLPDEN